jgi:hypothetical protein
VGGGFGYINGDEGYVGEGVEEDEIEGVVGHMRDEDHRA